MEKTTEKKAINKVKEPKKQAVSKSYTLTQFANTIKKLKTLKWLDKKDEEELKRIHTKMVSEYLKDKFNWTE